MMSESHSDVEIPSFTPTGVLAHLADTLLIVERMAVAMETKVVQRLPHTALTTTLLLGLIMVRTYDFRDHILGHAEYSWRRRRREEYCYSSQALREKVTVRRLESAREHCPSSP